MLMTALRMAALRLTDACTLHAKESDSSPVMLTLKPTPPLENAQLRRLAPATPWKPVMIGAVVDFEKWDPDTKAFEAEIHTIESLPRLPNDGKRVHRRKVPNLIKQKRGFVSFDTA